MVMINDLGEAHLQITQLVISDRKIRCFTPAPDVEQVDLRGQRPRHLDPPSHPTKLGKKCARIHDASARADDLRRRALILAERARWINDLLKVLDEKAPAGV